MWNGDVWRTIVYLRSQRPDLTVFVLDCDQGLGIVTKKKPADTLPMEATAIKNLTYADLVDNRQAFLNLKPANYFFDFFGIAS